MGCVASQPARFRFRFCSWDAENPVEPASQVPRSAKLVKICPNLRSVYSWHGRLYVRDGERYRHVERTHDELCDMTASYEAHMRDR